MSGQDDGKESEAEAMMGVIAAFLYYKTYNLESGICRRLQYVDSLSEHHRHIVSSLGIIDKIKEAEKLIRENYKLLLRIVHGSGIIPIPDPFAQDNSDFKQWYSRFFDARKKSGKPVVKDHHMNKLYSTLKMLVRDWSEEGQQERELTYGPLIDALERGFSQVGFQDRGKLNVLVPGAGLGRLAYEICCRGFSCQGNEFSYFMLLTSNYILNETEEVSQFVIYPYAHHFSNVVKSEYQMRAIKVPDTLPSTMQTSDSVQFSMVAGDFIEVYSRADQKEQWDAIVTCFFMDTANNVLDYLDTMWHAMKPGAIWINLGPLLWHFDNVDGESSIEFTQEEFMNLVAKIGFEVDESQFKDDISLPYTADQKSMLQYTYKSFMCVAKKPMLSK